MGDLENSNINLATDTYVNESQKTERKKIELPNIEIPSTSKVEQTKIPSKENLNVHPKQNQI